MTARRWLTFLVLACACDGASRDPGLDALLRVEGAQYVPGALPAPDGGPEVESVRVPHRTVLIGTRRERISGALAEDANAVAIMRRGDTGHSIVTAGVPSVEEPLLPTFSAVLELSRRTPPGRFELIVSALDSAGRAGEPVIVALEASTISVDGELVFTLRWDNAADLDLHVIDPDGTELWARNINAAEPPPPGRPASDAGGWQSAGMLDFDSNASCVYDGRCEENAAWPSAPPPGTYRARVVTASLCGESAAHWSLEARLEGELVGSAEGVSLPSDTRATSGFPALAIEVP